MTLLYIHIFTCELKHMIIILPCFIKSFRCSTKCFSISLRTLSSFLYPWNTAWHTSESGNNRHLMINLSPYVFELASYSENKSTSVFPGNCFRTSSTITPCDCKALLVIWNREKFSKHTLRSYLQKT